METYNRPGTAFRSGGFIVLMMIAWTALFHAAFFKKKVKPYYHKKGSKRRFERVEGDYKTWELAECLCQFFKEQHSAVRKNLEFFIGLRNKIEHRFLPELDAEIFGECQATLINFEAMLAETFGGKYAVGPEFPFALQFSKVMQPQQQTAMRAATQKDLIALWTGAILHGSHNLYIQNIFTPLTRNTGKTNWTSLVLFSRS